MLPFRHCKCLDGALLWPNHIFPLYFWQFVLHFHCRRASYARVSLSNAFHSRFWFVSCRRFGTTLLWFCGDLYPGLRCYRMFATNKKTHIRMISIQLLRRYHCIMRLIFAAHFCLRIVRRVHVRFSSYVFVMRIVEMTDHKFLWPVISIDPLWSDILFRLFGALCGEKLTFEVKIALTPQCGIPRVLHPSAKSMGLRQGRA